MTVRGTYRPTKFDIYLETVNSPEEGEALTGAVKEGGAADLEFLLRPED